MESLLVFTDGGAFDLGDYNYRTISSYRIFKEEHKELLRKDVVHAEKGTSPSAEMSAIRFALKDVCKYVKAAEIKNIEVKLYTDSMLCHQSLTTWIYSWIKNAKGGVFYSRDKKPVVNQDMIKEAYAYILFLRKIGKVTIYHINSHTSKKNVKALKTKFEKFNKCKVSDDEFLFIYLQNAKCDSMIQEANKEFVESETPVNNPIERLKEKI